MLLLDPRVRSAVLAFGKLYCDLVHDLQPCIIDVTASCYSRKVIQEDEKQAIVHSHGMRSDQRVAIMLEAVQTSIRGDYRCLHRFVRALKKQRSSIELMGDKLYSLYCKC